MANDSKSGVMSNLDKTMTETYKLFCKYDRDNSETLEVSELFLLLQDCKIPTSEAEVKKCLKAMDTNGDGVMDFMEFMTFLGMIYMIRLSNKTAIAKEIKNKAKPPPPIRKSSLY
uniref:Calmodulin-like n=1 Tax=Ciona intestinalis TaxID=7719 RepID=F6S6F7_CIOIN|nr:calmodulin-like [Ciona intestinalis]|eukprot:XP_026692148.1 calmodulin-like [Ciona intestinalis]